MPEEPFHETDVEVEIIKRGVTQLHSIMQTFENWLDVARALDIGRNIAMRAAHTNQPAGRGYAEAFSRWMGMHPDLQRIKSPTRKALFDCLAHEQDILEWRHSQGDEERLRYNYPAGVYQRWHKATQERQLTEGTPAQPNGLRAENERLKEENDQLKRQLERQQRAADDAPLISRNATPDEMVRVLKEYMSATKFNAVAAKMMQDLQARSRG